MSEDLLYFHPENIIDFLGVDAQFIIRGDIPGHKEIGISISKFKLYLDVSIYFIMDVDSCLLLHLSSSTTLRGFILVPFTFRETKFVACSRHQYFSLLFVQNNGPADRLMLIRFRNKFLGFNFDARRAKLSQLIDELFLPSVEMVVGIVFKNNINEIIKGLFRVIAQSTSIIDLFTWQIEDKLAYDTLYDLSLLVVIIAHPTIKTSIINIPIQHSILQVIIILSSLLQNGWKFRQHQAARSPQTGLFP